jgi:hypothetical protein
MPYHYKTYGLEFVSDIQLPELTDISDPQECQTPDVVVRCAPVPLPEEVRATGAWYDFSEEGACFWWSTVGAFNVSANGCTIDVERAVGVSDDLIAFPLLGPVLSEVLRRQALFVLHASAVDIDGMGVALMADKGTGKSSSSAALLRSGAHLIADDLVAIDTREAKIIPGFAQVKLDEKMLDGLDAQKWIVRPRAHDLIDKFRVMVPDLLAPVPVPAARLYVIERGDSHHNRIEDIPQAMALPSILRFSYAARFGTALLSDKAAAEHFRNAVALSNKAVVKRLILANSLDHLDTLIDTIRDDILDGTTG